MVSSQRHAERLERASRASRVGMHQAFAQLGLKGRSGIGFCLGPHAVCILGLLPRAKIPTARRRASGAPAPGGVVPSERQWAIQRPRRDEEGTPRTLERRAGCSSSPAGSCLSAMGGAAARGTCAAWAARARPWRRASAARDGPARPPRTAPPRPADALRSPPIAGGEVELALLCAEGQGTQPALGRAYRAR